MGLDKVVIKFIYKDLRDLRRITLPCNKLEYSYLLNHIKTTFIDELDENESDYLTLRYTDSDGD